jgi:hypothetical protein
MNLPQLGRGRDRRLDDSCHDLRRRCRHIDRGVRHIFRRPVRMNHRFKRRRKLLVLSRASCLSLILLSGPSRYRGRHLLRIRLPSSLRAAHRLPQWKNSQRRSHPLQLLRDGDCWPHDRARNCQPGNNPAAHVTLLEVRDALLLNPAGFSASSSAHLSLEPQSAREDSLARKELNIPRL